MILALLLQAFLLVDGGDVQASTLEVRRYQDDCNVGYCVGDMCTLTALHCPSTIVDGGDVEKRAIPTPPSDCVAAWAEVRESRRLVKNTSITGALNAVSHFGLDLGTTAWADNRAACRNVAPGQPCLVEWNTLTPSSGGVFAAKVVIVGAVTGASYMADKKGHPRWATFIRWLGVLGGVVPAAWNIHRGLSVEKARATQ